MATYPINDENPPTGAGYRPGDIVVCPQGSVVPRWKYVGDEQWVPANVVEFVENEVTGGIKKLEASGRDAMEDIGVYARRSDTCYPGVELSPCYSKVVGDFQVVGAGSSIAMDSSVTRSGAATLRVTMNRGSASSTEVNFLHSWAPLYRLPVELVHGCISLTTRL